MRAAPVNHDTCFWNATAMIAALTVMQKFLALALNPDMREITPWIRFRCATLRSTILSVVGSATLNSPGFGLRRAHERRRRTALQIVNLARQSS